MCSTALLSRDTSYVPNITLAIICITLEIRSEFSGSTLLLQLNLCCHDINVTVESLLSWLQLNLCCHDINVTVESLLS